MGNSHFVVNYQEDNNANSNEDNIVDNTIDNTNTFVDINKENDNNSIEEKSKQNVSKNNSVNDSIDENIDNIIDNNIGNLFILNDKQMCDKSINCDLNNDVFLEEGDIIFCHECRKKELEINKLNFKVIELQNDLLELNEMNMEKFTNYDKLTLEYENTVAELKKKLKGTKFNLDYHKEINNELKINFKILKLKLRERIKCKKLLQLDLDHRISRRHST